MEVGNYNCTDFGYNCIIILDIRKIILEVGNDKDTHFGYTCINILDVRNIILGVGKYSLTILEIIV